MNTRIPVEILTNSNVITTDNITNTINNYTGATTTTDGVRGFVPPALIAERNSFLRGDGSWSSSVFNVEQDVSTSDNDYPLLLTPIANATSDQGPREVIFGSGIKANPSTSTITATTFVGALTGNAATSTKLAAGKDIDGMSFDGSANIAHYTTSSTAAATAQKEAYLTGFTLSTGARVLVKFSNTNTASNPTLKIGSTDAKAIYLNGAAVPAYYLQSGIIYEFVYNGTQYDVVDGKVYCKFTSTDPGNNTAAPSDLQEGGILIYTSAS